MAKDLPLIQGHRADSIQEVWLSQALENFGIEYIFQFEVAGGLRLRGGLIVDFMLTHPKLIPLEYYGDYWHEEEMAGEDLLRIKQLEQLYGRVLILWEHEANTREQIFTWVKKNVL